MARIDTTDFDDQRLASELRAMERSYDGVVQQFRLEDLRHRLDDHGSIPAAHSWNGWCGDRVTMWLDDGSVLKLHLFWPIRRGIATLRRVGWTSQIGWVIDVRTTDGDDHRLYAWKARLMRPAC
ncbi:MAG: hypothetical protein R2713_02890 [Ilumatobacteraceae bacterium]|nr:hypothetical protein [Acidimicrobiales bacterium]